MCIHRVDIKTGEQFQRWYLEEINPLGEVPAIKHKNKVITDSTPILEYLDKNFGEPGQLFPEKNDVRLTELLTAIDSVNVFAISFGIVGCHSKEFVSKLRFPFSVPAIQEGVKRALPTKAQNIQRASEQFSDIAAGKVLAEKSSRVAREIAEFSDLEQFKAIIVSAENVLDDLEKELGQDDRDGPWLGGHNFTAADVTLATFLVRMYLLGLDERFWGEGKRPNLARYWRLAYERPSVDKANDLKENEGKFVLVQAAS